MADAAPPIANIDAVLADPAARDRNEPGPGFGATIGFIGRVLETRGIGVNVTVTDPGKKAWPRHYHYATDEMFVILEGVGTLHYGEAAHPLKPGDVVSITAGAEIPFQIENTGAEPLKYLALSTMPSADVFVYPDSGKVGYMGGGPPMRGPTSLAGRKRLKFVPEDQALGYWDGELDDKS